MYIVATGIIIKFQNKFLLIKRPNGVHAAGMLAFPGGKVEFSDSENKAETDILINAAKREVFEELGVKINEPLKYIKSAYFFDSIKNKHVINTMFFCIINEMPKINASKREVPEYYWLTKEEIFAAENAAEWLKDYVLCTEKIL